MIVGQVLQNVGNDAASTPRKRRSTVLCTLDFLRTVGADLVPGHLRTTLIAVATFADERGVCWPSYRALAQLTGRCRRTVMRHIKELQSFVHKRLRFRAGDRSPGQPLNRSNLYCVHIPNVAPRSARQAVSESSPTPPPVVRAPTRTQTNSVITTVRPFISPAASCENTRKVVMCTPANEGGRSSHRVDAGDVQCAHTTAILRALQTSPVLAPVANATDAGRLWEFARSQRRTVADVEQAIAELLSKAPSGAKWSRSEAWGRVVAFVEHVRSNGRATPPSNAREELQRDAADRKRDDDARRGAVPMPANIVAELRKRGLLGARAP